MRLNNLHSNAVNLIKAQRGRQGGALTRIVNKIDTESETFLEYKSSFSSWKGFSNGVHFRIAH